ncbi:MAG: Snf7 family protein [archaeon]
MFQEKRSIVGKMKEAISPRPMRDKLVSALHTLNMQLHRIERTSAQLQTRDKALYDKCVTAVKNTQPEMAALYAQECNEIRKVAKVALNSQFALERVVLRLDAVKEFGDIAHTMTPLRGVIGSVRSSLANAMPDISLKLAEVDETLQGMVGDIGIATETQPAYGSLTGEAQKILQEASTLAEQQVKDKFPDLPSIQSTEPNLKPATGPF